MRKLWKSGCGLLLGALPLAALSGTLPDPTRIPAEVMAPGAHQAASRNTGLQSVIIAPGRRAAIINGQTVEQGGKYGDARLVQVNEDSVVLHGPEGKQVMTLFPGVKIRKDVKQPLLKLPASRQLTEKKTAIDAAPREGK
jgi:MSHA biogenesis protein MshK